MADKPDDVDDLDEELDDEEPDLEDDDLDDDALDADDVVDDDKKPAAAASDDDESDDDDDDEVDPDDVEADLDTILKDRLVVADEEDDEDEEEAPEVDDRTEGGTRVRPKAPGEFVCQSCFLVKHPSQLADADAMLCRDCV